MDLRVGDALTFYGKSLGVVVNKYKDGYQDKIDIKFRNQMYYGLDLRDLQTGLEDNKIVIYKDYNINLLNILYS